ncbi:MAG: hypothetical protein QOJ11_1749 [Frankiales bacterium]|jgi:hypothetical protein|nr:hypothetical protein [Frankiales bacterium]
MSASEPQLVVHCDSLTGVEGRFGIRWAVGNFKLCGLFM